MHINVHIAIGVITTSVLDYFFNFSILEFLFIVFSSFICDFDVFFSKYAKDHNHRLLITHSIIPSLVIIIMGFILQWSVLILSGYSYALHIIIDTTDWGTNFFYFQKKLVGFKFLISKEEFNNLSNYLAKYKVSASFFDEKYYGNKLCIGIEILSFALMIIFPLTFALQYVIVILIYFIGLYFHLHRHFALKRIERDNKKSNF